MRLNDAFIDEAAAGVALAHNAWFIADADLEGACLARNLCDLSSKARSVGDGAHLVAEIVGKMMIEQRHVIEREQLQRALNDSKRTCIKWHGTCSSDKWTGFLQEHTEKVKRNINATLVDARFGE